jgi:hypothetical protein
LFLAQRAPGTEGRKQFFSEEKNQKTFAFYAYQRLIGYGLCACAGAGTKVFWFFLQKRTTSFSR